MVGSFGAKSSEHWKKKVEKFQALEGFLRGVSNRWKFFWGGRMDAMDWWLFLCPCRSTKPPAGPFSGLSQCDQCL